MGHVRIEGLAISRSTFTLAEGRWPPFGRFVVPGQVLVTCRDQAQYNATEFTRGEHTRGHGAAWM
jgi:hypothetical protein